MTIRSISALLLDFKTNLPQGKVSIDAISNALHEREFGFVLFILALPMALPLPVPPGINVLLASPLVLLTLQQALGRKTIWIPKSWRNKTIDKKKIITMIDKAVPFLRTLEHLIKPRIGVITQPPFSHIIGLAGLIMALTVCIPLPLTNTIPSLGIALMSAGVLMRDGLAVMAGLLVGILWVGLLAYVTIVFGVEGIDFVKETIKSFL